MVRAMFPDVPTAAIQADLQRTGSVETTVDNALRDGGLPLVIYICVFDNISILSTS
jgi:coupling of ubiquitin conjugation to ER degradation protein 1